MNRRIPHIIQPNIKKKSNLLTLLNNNSTINKIQNQENNLLNFENNLSLKEHLPIKTPRSELNLSLSTTRSYSSVNLFDELHFDFELKPLLIETNLEEKSEIFIKKCKQCYFMCNFLKSEQFEAIQNKTNILNELLEFIKDQNSLNNFGRLEYSSLLHLFITNIIRSPPKSSLHFYHFIEIDFLNDKYEEISWPHLSIIYDILIEFILNRKFSIRFCSSNDIKKIIYSNIFLFNSLDIREREKLSKLFHIIYRQMNSLRIQIKNFVSSFLRLHLLEKNSPIGILELLNSFSPIVSGYKTPLLKENQDFFINTILPLHSSEYLKYFHNNLISIILIFCEKQNDLLLFTLKILLNKWPISSPQKQVLYFIEIQYLIEKCKIENTSTIIIPLCKIISYSLLNSSFSVIEKALLLWESDFFSKLIAHYGISVFEIIVPSIYQTAMTHWCHEVKKLAIAALSVLKNSNPSVFDLIGSQLKQIESEKALNQMNRGFNWKNIIKKGSSNPYEINKLLNNISKIFIGCEGIK